MKVLFQLIIISFLLFAKMMLELLEKMNIKLRKIIYPEQTKEEIESICSSLNEQKNRLSDVETKFYGDFMIKN